MTFFSGKHREPSLLISKIAQYGLHKWLIFLVLLSKTCLGALFRNIPVTCDRSMVREPCQAYLDYQLYATDSAEETAKNQFADQMHEKAIYINETDGSLFVSVNCFCTEDNMFVAYTNYQIGSNSNITSADIQMRYRGLAWMPSQEIFTENATISIRLPCRCDDEDNGHWKYLSYFPRTDDIIGGLLVKFDSNLTVFLAANNLTSANDALMDDRQYYIPLLKVYGVLLDPSTEIPEMEGRKQARSKIVAILGITAAGLFLIIAITAAFIVRGLWHWRPKKPSPHSYRRPRSEISINSDSDKQITLT